MSNTAPAPTSAPAPAAPVPTVIPGFSTTQSQAILTILNQLQQNAPQPQAPAPPAPPRMKVKDPKPFDGTKREDLPLFLDSLRVKFQAEPRLFEDSERNKILFAVSFLEGNAQTLARTHYEEDEEAYDWDGYVDLEQWLEASFVDPDPQATAEAALRSLFQKNRTAADYLTEFS